MRCVCCNRLLTPQQSTRRFAESGDFVDMCDVCLDTISDVVDTKDSDVLDEIETDDDDQ